MYIDELNESRKLKFSKFNDHTHTLANYFLVWAYKLHLLEPILPTVELDNLIC